ncbi:MAG: hypothetical protein CSA65_01310 [Proteobacteria bacterium]|nr:MAG: hypothetical protein CSA65_01310 [Pseudomonadota bacterium]
MNSAKTASVGCLGALILLIPTVACSPDLGLSPFICNRGVPECPEDYVCVKAGFPDPGVCVKRGEDPPKGQDGGPADAPKPNEAGGDLPSRPDGSKPDGPPKPDTVTSPDQTPPPAGKVVITEFMANPSVVNDATGEYVEVFNPGKASVNIHGWILRDNGSDKHVIDAPGAQLIVPPLSFIVLGRSSDKALNGGISVSYAYSSFFLSNSADEVYLEDPSGKVVDGFEYSAAKGFTISTGASYSVKNPLSTNKSDGAQWCTEANAWTGSAGDKGTPGSPPGC